ncbi:MAG: hypothetical protein WC869_09360 [Phycisphaerae bacterium]|jgi:hypothetical protein
MPTPEFLLYHVYANHIQDHSMDPRKAAQFFVDRGMFNGIMVWVDHQKRVIRPPEVEWFKKHDLAIMFEFWTNDRYTPFCAKLEGFGDDLAAYNEFWCRLILDYLAALGPGKSYWNLGHEHYDMPPFRELTDDGQVVARPAVSRRDGFEKFKRWVLTNQHQLAWEKHVATFPQRREQGLQLNDSDTFTFLRERGLAIPHGLMLGGTLPQNAHYQFELIPQQEMFWWECMHPIMAGVQVGMSFLRGACAQYHRKALADVAPYGTWRTWHKDREEEAAAKGFVQPYSPYWTVYDEQGRKYAGYSESLHSRVWMSLWAGGVDQMLHEDSIATHLLACGGKLELSPLGKAAEEFADLSLRRAKDRGEVIATAAIVLPFLHGMCPPAGPNNPDRVSWQPIWHHDRLPWRSLEPDQGDWSIAQFFDVAFPQAGLLPPWPYSSRVDSKNAERSGLAHAGRAFRMGLDMRALELKHVTSCGWGDGLDVLLDNASVDTLRRYPAAVLLGSFDSDSPVADKVLEYVRGGGRALVSADLPGLDKLGFSAGPVVAGAAEIRLADGSTLAATAAYKVRQFSAPNDAEALAKDSAGNVILWQRTIGSGQLWLVAIDHLMAEPVEGHVPVLASFVPAILDRFFDPHLGLKMIAPPMQWCLARNSQGLRLYLANHNPFDALPIVRIQPGVCGVAAPTETVLGREFVQDKELPITACEGQFELEVLVPAFGFRLIDIPATPLPRPSAK